MPERDPGLEHQLILRIPNNQTTVSCNCRAVFGKHSPSNPSDFYDPMIQVGDETVFQTYNKSDNHWAEFLPEDRIAI